MARTAMFTWRALMKSMMELIKESILFISSLYTKFCEETTLHGLKHTVTKNFNIIERLLWFILISMAFTGAIYCAISQLARYNSEPVVVSLQRDYRSWTFTFPAVTACFMERMDQEKMKAVIQRFWNVTEDNQEKFQYYQEFMELITDISFRENLQNFWKYQNDASLKGIDLLQLAIDVHPDFALNVTLSHRVEVQWIPVMTEEGLCMTFNSEYAQFQQISDVRRRHKLMMCHYHSEFCFVRIDASTQGVRYFIHSPYDIATAISNPTGGIYPGDELNTDFKMVEIVAADRIKSLRPEQRRCKYPDEWLADSIKAYSFGLCQMHCRTKMAIMFCGCRPYFHTKGVREE
ncbi:unnamed protein product [Pieris macdunnoughi]|uniref:Uncharacterized protein n=1 Tax=Pieris macdunnoughi TaxID=345717 RepID=A0A821XQM4_9NEOP|nr:unnamed protein product [Pieris macdunnoughi]